MVLPHAKGAWDKASYNVLGCRLRFGDKAAWKVLGFWAWRLQGLFLRLKTGVYACERYFEKKRCFALNLDPCSLPEAADPVDPRLANSLKATQHKH